MIHWSCCVVVLRRGPRETSGQVPARNGGFALADGTGARRRTTPTEILAARPEQPPPPAGTALDQARVRMEATGQWHPRQSMGQRWSIGCVALEIIQRCNLDCTLCYDTVRVIMRNILRTTVGLAAAKLSTGVVKRRAS